jgi:hypothetical protein
MELEYNLLERVLSNEFLNNLIETNLLNVVLEYCNQEYKQINCLQCNSNQFHNGILTVLRGPSKPLITFTLTHLLPNYLNVNDDKVRNILLIEIFTLIKETKKLEILCVLYDKFITADFNSSNFNLLKLR